MGMNLVQKISNTHRVSGQVVPGEGISIFGDHTLLHNVSGAMATHESRLPFEARSLRLGVKLGAIPVEGTTPW